MIQITHGIKTHEQITREMGGGDWSDNVQLLKREMELLKDAGVTPVQTTVKGGNDDEDD